jgi:NAD+ synthase (glutamine-hydrolysing)
MLVIRSVLALSGYKNNGIVEVAALSPTKICIGDPGANVDRMLDAVREMIRLNRSGERRTRVAVFPELSVTGYTCGDLFNQSALLSAALEALGRFVEGTNDEYCPLIFVGMPLRKDNQLFNCAVAVFRGKILGVVPKTFIPNYGVYYEARYFAPAFARLSDSIDLFGSEIPFTTDILFDDLESGAVVGAEICEDLWVPVPPSSLHCLHGANIAVNLSASNETIGKTEYRRDLVRMHSATSVCGYVYASASRDESTTDTVFSGHCLVADDGYITAETTFSSNSDITFGEIDIERCENDRAFLRSYMGVRDSRAYKRVTFSTFSSPSADFYSRRELPLLPFVPRDIDSRSEEILRIQAAGLAQRLSKIGFPKAVVGISGGLDSTLALIACVEAFKINGRPLSDIMGVTMPGFGTTGRTLGNAKTLMGALGVTTLEIPIAEACMMHFRDIGQDPDKHDVTYENVQARERTQVLMDTANKNGAIVVGTGDLSELALGWCTYNGDQMSMYGVNSSIPKTLVRGIVRSYAGKQPQTVREVLYDICDTPISPELLPPNPDGTIAQKTESSIGSYDVHDFILYYMLRYGFGPKKIYDLYINSASLKAKREACAAADGEKVLRDMRTFYRRFFAQQFKRSCMPDGIKVGSVSLSPRGDWRMPSDASAAAWLRELEKL